MESIDYFEELQNTYIGIDLSNGKSCQLRRILESCQELSNVNLSIPRDFHLTIDYLGNKPRDILEEVIDIIESSILFNVKRITGQVRYILGAPKHFKSSKTGEDIFYLPVCVNNILIKSFKHIGHSINEPHLTLLKGKDLREEEVEKILGALKLVLIGRRYNLHIRNLCMNGTRENGEKYKKNWSFFAKK